MPERDALPSLQQDAPRVTLDLREDDARELFDLVGRRNGTERWSRRVYFALGHILSDLLADEANDRRFPDG